MHESSHAGDVMMRVLKRPLRMKGNGGSKAVKFILRQFSQQLAPPNANCDIPLQAVLSHKRITP